MKTIRLLIGSCGGLTGIYLSKQFARFNDILVFGADCSKNNACRFFNERIFELPSASDSDFIDKLIDLLVSENIDFYLPTHSKEISRIAEYEKDIRKRVKTEFIVCPVSTFQALNNKKNAYRNLDIIGIAVPEVYDRKNVVKYPAFYKPNEGSGGSNCRKIICEDDYPKNSKNGILCEYIEGIEYTVDCLYDRNGVLLGYNQRRRIKSMGGAVIITSNDNSFNILPYIKKISDNWVFKGAVNFQYILRDRIPVFTDINLRYASGGLALSVVSGVDVPRALYKMFTNEPIESKEFSSDFKNRTMYRTFEEKFIDESFY